MKKNILQCMIVIITFLLFVIIPSAIFKWQIKVEAAVPISIGIIYAYVLKHFLDNRKKKNKQDNK
jgi:hypothetical protein